MGLFDKLKKNKESENKEAAAVQALGWDAITAEFERVYPGQTTGIDAYQKSNITGFICVPDTTVSTIETPNGRVEFLTFIGMTDAELKTLNTLQSVQDIYAKLGSDITDYNRKSLV